MEELDLKDLFDMFWAKKVFIVIIMLIFILVGILYAYLTVSPEYQSYTTFLLVQSEKKDDTAGITQADITLNQKLVSTYKDLIKSKSLIREVITNLGIDKTYDQLKNKISVTYTQNTEFIKLTVTDEDPEVAKAIANEATAVFTKMIEEIYKMNNVYVIDDAEVSNTPSNVNAIRNIIILSAITGLVLAMVAVSIANMFNNTIRQASDIEKATKLVVLAEIPNYAFDERGGSN